MSVVISSSLTIADTVSGGGVIDGDNPLIGYQTLVTAANIAADSMASGYPASNMANPSTALRWLGVTSSPAADEYLTLTLDTLDDVDYVAIARHNLGSAQITVSIEILNEATSPASWDELVQETLLPDDGPALFRFTPQPIGSIRIRLQPGTAAPTIAVVQAGALLVMQRKLYVGHQPMNYARKTKITNGRSESGQFLGRIVVNRMTETGAKFQNLTPAWVRENLAPFLLAAQEAPFFFAWRPESYPREVGYAWLTNDPRPANQLANGMMSIDLSMGGVT